MVVFIEVNASLHVLSVLFEILWVALVQNGHNFSSYTAKLKLEVIWYA
jgi:hypothetical protein